MFSVLAHAPSGDLRRCTMRSSDMMVIAMDVANEKALVAYPIGLFYACFALISVF